MKITRMFPSLLGIAIIISLVTVSCEKDKDDEDRPMGPDVNAWVLSDDNKIMLVNAATGITSASVTLTGIPANQNIISIDFRPATGQLYGLSTESRIYVINTKTGEARAIGSSAFSTVLSGKITGFDFNPTVDRIRVVTAEGQNLRIHPETGAVAAVDGNIANSSSVTAVAYTENMAGATTTVLFDIDTKNDKLFKQDPPNMGTLVEVGALGVDAEPGGGFDISPDGKAALAVLSVNKMSGLYTMDLTTGKATLVAALSGNIVGIAIPTEPVAYMVSTSNELIIYNMATGVGIPKMITGMQPGEEALGVDTRPVNGELYVLGSTSRIYTLNASSGAATVVGSAAFATQLAGTSFGFDFNPTVDRIRIVSNTGQNLRVHPETGVVAFVDGILKPGTPAITAAAYINNFAGATTTTLFDIDSETNILYKQDPPNDGTITAVGPLNIDVTAANGFDIGSTSGTAYAVLTTTAGSKLYTINLTTGAASAVKDLSLSVRGFSVGLGF